MLLDMKFLFGIVEIIFLKDFLCFEYLIIVTGNIHLVLTHNTQFIYLTFHLIIILWLSLWLLLIIVGPIFIDETAPKRMANVEKKFSIKHGGTVLKGGRWAPKTCYSKHKVLLRSLIIKFYSTTF